MKEDKEMEKPIKNNYFVLLLLYTAPFWLLYLMLYCVRSFQKENLLLLAFGGYILVPTILALTFVLSKTARRVWNGLIFSWIAIYLYLSLPAGMYSASISKAFSAVGVKDQSFGRTEHTSNE